MKVTSSVEIMVLGGNVIVAHILDDGETCKLIIEHERFEDFSVEVVPDKNASDKFEVYDY